MIFTAVFRHSKIPNSHKIQKNSKVPLKIHDKIPTKLLFTIEPIPQGLDQNSLFIILCNKRF